MSHYTSSEVLRERSDAENVAPLVDYRLIVPTTGREQARAWLWLGLVALVGSGLFSILLVLGRTPGINAVLPGIDFFHTALVVHVDLSVLVWFVAVAGLLWDIHAAGRAKTLGWVALLAAAAGTFAMVLAPFIDPGAPVMANYVPVLESPLFLGGLGVFAVGGAALVVRALLVVPSLSAQRLDGATALRTGLYAAALSTALAIVAFGWSLASVPPALDSRIYWELLFWGGGHALQYTWTLLLLCAWLWLACACGARVPLSSRLVVLLFALAFAPALSTLYAYLAFDVLSPEHRAIHTAAMRFGGGIAVFPVLLAVGLALFRTRRVSAEQRPLRAALCASLVLFAVGGLIGFSIDGSNVKIPAHYHGCIVGVTLALMGLVYHLLPQLGYRTPHGTLAATQPWLYGLGQLLHISGLMWSGGYGVQRKVAGAEQVLRTPGEVFGMGLMGFGGLIAIVGGLLFVVVVWRALLREAQ